MCQSCASWIAGEICRNLAQVERWNHDFYTATRTKFSTLEQVSFFPLWRKGSSPPLLYFLDYFLDPHDEPQSTSNCCRMLTLPAPRCIQRELRLTSCHFGRQRRRPVSVLRFLERLGIVGGGGRRGEKTRSEVGVSTDNWASLWISRLLMYGVEFGQYQGLRM
jgi:hypothetical protein